MYEPQQEVLPVTKQHFRNIREDMEALTARLIQTEQTLLDTRQQVAAVPKASALLVDTRTIGKAPKLIGRHRDWPEWPFQFTACMGSTNPKSIAQASVVPCLGTVVQKKRPCHMEHRSTQWTRGVARAERRV